MLEYKFIKVNQLFITGYLYLRYSKKKMNSIASNVACEIVTSGNYKKL